MDHPEQGADDIQIKDLIELDPLLCNAIVWLIDWDIKLIPRYGILGIHSPTMQESSPSEQNFVVKQTIWFCSAPITQDFLQRIKGLKISTYAFAYAEVPPGGHTVLSLDHGAWFQISLWRPVDAPDGTEMQTGCHESRFRPGYSSLSAKRRKDGSKYIWRLGQNIRGLCAFGPKWTTSETILRGYHPLWNCLEVGDIIAIEAGTCGFYLEGSGFEIITWGSTKVGPGVTPQQCEMNGGGSNLHDPSDIFGCLNDWSIGIRKTGDMTTYSISCLDYR
jgi:hypothetical protein